MPSIPTPTASDNPFDVALWNPLAAAVRERTLACTRYGVYSVFAPLTWAAGHDLSAGNYSPDMLASTFKIRRIADMQYLLSGIADSYVRDGAFPDGFAGLDGRTVDLLNNDQPDSPVWSGYKIAQQLGRTLPPYSEVETVSHGINPFYLPFRRKMPRRITGLTDTKARDLYGGSTMPTYGPELGTCAVGDRAQWYNLASSNPYRGVYQLAAGGTWVPCPAGAAADVLDSDAAWKSKDWCPPGYFTPGDYIGWWLARDVADVARLFKWSALQPTTFVEGDPGTLPGGGGGYYNGVNASGLTRSAAIAAYNAATPSVTFTGTNGVHQKFTQEIENTSEGEDSGYHRAFGTNCRMGYPVWRGVAGSAFLYAHAQVAFQGTAFDPGTFDAQGVAGLVQDRFGMVKSYSISAVASPTAYEPDAQDVWPGHDVPPNWNPTPNPGHPFGFWVRHWRRMVKWSFDYTA